MRNDLMRLKMIIYLVISVLGLWSVTEGQIVQDGQCDPNIAVATDFNINDFMGKWYEISRTENPYQGSDCSTIEFSNSDGTITLNSVGVNNNFREEFTGNVIEEDTAKMSLSLSTMSEDIDFWILEMNHEHFAVGYNCINLDSSQRSVNVWVLGRNSEIQFEMMVSLINTTLFNLLDIHLEQLYDLDHSDDACYQLPEIEAGQPIILPGHCNADLQGVQNFDAVKFAGVWHEISSYERDIDKGTCPRSEISTSESDLSIQSSQVMNQTLKVVNGHATLSADGNGKLTVSMDDASESEDIWILATDYEEYAVLYACNDLPDDQKRVYSWIASRTRQLTTSAQASVNEALNLLIDLNSEYYQKTEQDDDACFYYPEPVLDEPVIFRGECDMSIPAIPNFEFSRFMGIWHEIESYPTVYHIGTCNNAVFTQNNEKADLANTQVVDEKLLVVNGEALIASEDGSGRLLAILQIPETNTTLGTDYWVLATDYDSYAFVYTCQRHGTDQREVWSWKLSRTKEMPTAGTTAINEVISTIPVLDDRYYQPRNQSREGCFFYPEPKPGVPVVFPGQCDETVPVMEGFDLSQFEGTWHEIESYPKVQQTGGCINHEYSTTSSSSSSLVSSQILDQFMENLEGTITSDSDSDAAKLSVSVTINNAAVSFPFWILNTDYTDYALAYSCIQLNSDFKGIWSWKLSRTKELSENAVQTINSITSTITVLDNVYYENVDQSDDACFYLPDLEPGEPIVLFGQCDPNIPVIQNFDPSRYEGRWRIIESYPTDSQVGTCNDATYNWNGNEIEVFNTQVFSETLRNVSGTATVATTDGSGKLIMNLPDDDGPTEYWILDTDYDSYALVYSCADLTSEQRRVWSWKLSRTRELTTDAVTAINQIVDRINVLNNRYYQTLNHTDEGCFYFPTPDGNPVVFRGQCDESINVVTDFNINRYMGVWYSIENYPVEFENGTCATSNYIITSDGVDISKTQVINEELDSIAGTAVLAGDDEIAKLIVTFPSADGSNDVSYPYWVLATDYDNYALVYSCVNLNDEYRSVSSWKLSRQKSLSAPSVTAINSVIANIDILDQDYYVNREHNDEGCFYYPVPVPGQPVVFPGQCDATIQGVPNFNVASFSGLWHEIAAYPKKQQQGQCINHAFIQSDDSTYTLSTDQVVDQLLFTAQGSATQSTGTDSSGQFQIRIYIDNTAIDLPFWILATDYEDYALAYSCINIDSNTRGVWSWKLSRTKQLSTAANTAIDEVISSVQVLGEQYYETIQQSDEACFFYPVLGPNEPVVFVGQCDQNIAVVQDFDPERYEGRWRIIESYPTDSQVGTCNDATYNWNGNEIEVFNTQVVSETLRNVSGTATVATTDGSGKLIMNLPDDDGPTEYWILDTDYDSYALVYSCADLTSEQRRVWSWKLSRTRELTTDAVTAISQVVDRINVLDNRYYQTLNHTDEGCFYFPTPDGNPVVFRGQCDESISVVTDFNIDRYMGIWYSIENYPVEFENGTCATSNYIITSDGVDISKTQVIYEELDSIAGTAVLAGDDEIAKLIVTFPSADGSNDVSYPYWVLATDYDNYALVYSCVNLNDEYRSVSSWKLSRQKSLSAPSVTAINSVIANIDILDQDYYVNRDHNDEGCFYYPVPVPGQPVVFPGQCDATIQGVPNFNVASFSGLWHEIAAYPKKQQQGQCINHAFIQSDDSTYTLSTHQVVDQLLFTAQGSATQSTGTDSSGQFQIRIYIDNTAIDLPFWILATDYEDYALAYSCINIDSNTRGVWSWKLSRTKQLSTAANTAIDEVISSVQVLGEQYYENIKQTDETCFFYPVLGPNEPVVFVGQCDQNIAVVQDFDPERYAGRWFDIESYYETSQQGTCNDASFILSDNVFAVSNTQVVAETLDVNRGEAVIASDGSGKLVVTLNISDTDVITNYWILDTDYESYSLVYSCEDLDSETRRVNSWKLSRTRQLSDEAQSAINTIVDAINVLDEQYYNTRDHSEEACFYYPEPVPGQNVLFRGQCDQSIEVVQDFNLENYDGIWYKIESYPEEGYDGTCATGRYVPTADGFEVYNTQVVAEELDSRNGTAVLDSNDNSAKLTVNFPDATMPYWVLATDYDNYALVYSCVSVDDEYRRVNTWKLSREKTLTEASETAINTAMNKVQVLRQPYFEISGHAENDCFYYPDNFGGPVILNGQCEDAETEVETDFNLNDFSGTWHEAARFPSQFQTGECAASKYELNDNSFTITQTIVHNERLNTMLGRASVSEDGKGILTASFDGVASDLTIYVLGTDYSEYALLYSCRNIDSSSKQIFSWKLSRTRSDLSDSANEKIDELVTKHVDLFGRYYQNTDQSNDSCFHYPVFDELPPSIILPGPCDDRIRAKTNFDFSAYLGRWFEISKYPQENDAGECYRIEFDDIVTSITYTGTHVNDKILEVTVGSANVVSTDGTGVLEITTVSDDNEMITFSHYVLETDYTSFALVYSCRNLEDGNSEVSSWKLSRERTLSDEANNIIDNVISNTRGLLEEYYTSVSQSDEDCFYIPKENPDEMVVFRGQCEDITGVEGFDIQKYLGWWHEIERYPTDSLVGECTSAQFQASGNQYQVVDTNIFHLTALFNTSTIQASSDGRLRKTLSTGEIVDIWVLATDYETYSLLYSCENINDEYRRVWSAKHSKSRELTDTAQSALQSVIDSNLVLYTQFYILVDQRDSACFHYPELDGEVILPGQCDSNIPVQQNFAPAEYSGTWYLTERYPTGVASSAICIGFRYTFNVETEVAEVLDWEINDDVLSTVEGTATISSNDNSGRLEIVYSIENSEDTLTKEIYILTTDYVTYSLVYTCANVNQFQRSVGVWKYSRTRTMPSSGTSAINLYMGQREELHQPYFDEIEQDEDCEEPNMAMLIRSSIIVLFVCIVTQFFV